MALLFEREINRQVIRRLAAWQLALTACSALPFSMFTVGCGLQAAPQQPSLYLPKPIPNLTASRAGNQVHLDWTTPHETTDKLRLHAPVRLRICSQVSTSSCDTVATISADAGKPATYTNVLPPSLVTGAARPIHYEIFAVNKHGRSAGPSNAAAVLAGQTPPEVHSLSATEVERGAILHWAPTAGLPSGTFIELQRKLLTPPSHPRAKTASGLPPLSEPADQTLRVDLQPGGTDPGGALDVSVKFDRSYQYIAMRVTEVQLGTQKLRLESAPSKPAEITTRDIYPPAAPTELAAVPVSAAINHGVAEVDLSWSANSEPDFAQYLVFRRKLGSVAEKANSALRQIAPENPAAPIVAPAFRDLRVQPGQRYAYSVVAVDDAGNKSKPSMEIQVTVPTD
jgi:hypothetical protein